MSTGERIKKLREDADISQEELAKRLNMDRSSLSQIENGKRSLKEEEIIAFSIIFNITIDQLLGMDEIPEMILNETPAAYAVSRERINIPTKNVEKFKQVLLYILSKVGAKANVGETVLYKLLYFIDFNYYEKYEEQLTGATYIKNHHGPTPIEFKNIVAAMIENGELEMVKSKHFQFDQKKYLPHVEANLALLNALEIQLIDDVLYKLSNMNAAAISEYSHNDVPWMVTLLGKPIDYETVFYRTAQYSVREYLHDDFC
jgi:transcriptional regulator with XRE-family HTH domain